MVIPELFPVVRNSIELTFTVKVFTVGFTSGVEPESELQAKIPKANPRMAKISGLLILLIILFYLFVPKTVF